MTQINNHRRINDILLGPLERPTLKWLASHMPAWVTPDTCTIVGVLGALGVTASYLLTAYDRNFLWLASLGFVVNWLGGQPGWNPGASPTDRATCLRLFRRPHDRCFQCVCYCSRVRTDSLRDLHGRLPDADRLFVA